MVQLADREEQPPSNFFVKLL